MDLKETLGYTSKGLAFQAFDVPAEQLRPPIGVVDGAVRRKGRPALAVGPGCRPWDGGPDSLVLTFIGGWHI